MTTMTPARSGPGVTRRRPSDDLALTGKLFHRLFLTGGAGILLHGAFVKDGRWIEIGVGAAGLVVGAISTRFTWERVPSSVARCVPLLAVAMLSVLSLASMDAVMPLTIALALTVVWTGMALELVDLVVTSALLTAVLIGSLWRHLGASVAVPQAVSASVLLIGFGASMYWLRGQFDLAQERIASAQQGVADAALAAERSREHQESERATIARVERADHGGVRCHPGHRRADQPVGPERDDRVGAGR